MRRVRTFLLAAAALAACERTPATAQGSVAAWSIEAHGGTGTAREVATKAIERTLRDEAPEAVSWERILDAGARALERAGWAEGEIAARVDTTGARPLLVLDLSGVRPTRLAAWSWEDSTTSPIAPGVWVPARRDEQVQARLADVVERGYPFASVQIVSAEPGPSGIAVRARLDPGPMLVLSGVRVEGAVGTRPGVLERLSGLRRERPLRAREAREGRERLARTGLFRTVEGPWLRLEGAGRGAVVYRAEPLPQNRAEGAVGYDGQRRTLSGFVHVDLGNLFGTLRHLRASWERFDRDHSRLDAGYREPYLLGLPLALELSLAQEIEDSTWTDDDARALIEGEVGGGLRSRVGMSAHRTVYSLEPASRTRRVSTLLGLAMDRTRDAGTAGWQFDMELERGELRRTPGARRGEGSLTRLSARAERTLLLGRMGQIRGEVHGGWIEGPDSLPRPEALALGGAQSLRGYPEEAFRALRFAVARIEAGVRLLPEGNRIYAFADGAILRPWPGGEDRTREAYGVGVRVRGGGGWARLDYGIPSGADPLSGRVHFRLETRF